MGTGKYKIKVFCDPIGMEELCKKSPFNLKKDLKGISDDERRNIERDIADEIIYSINNPPTIVVLYEAAKGKVYTLKVRTVDRKREKGKSNGYRCIVLYDNVNKAAFILHIYRHGHGEDKNISNADKSQIKKLAQEYLHELNKMKK